MKAFKLKPLVAALLAAGVCRAHAAALVPPRLLPIGPAVNDWNFSDDMPVWVNGERFQLISCNDVPGNGRPTLRLVEKNTAEVLDFSMVLSLSLAQMGFKLHEQGVDRASLVTRVGA